MLHKLRGGQKTTRMFSSLPSPLPKFHKGIRKLQTCISLNCLCPDGFFVVPELFFVVPERFFLSPNLSNTCPHGERRGSAGGAPGERRGSAGGAPGFQIWSRSGFVLVPEGFCLVPVCFVLTQNDFFGSKWFQTGLFWSRWVWSGAKSFNEECRHIFVYI